MASTQQELKLQAAQRALAFVEAGMVVGLGSGSTATLWIELLGKKVRDEGLAIRAIASSESSERLGRSYGIPFTNFDEIAPGLALIKGGGGQLLREKIVASATRRFVIVADASKNVDRLGNFPLPVEVIPMAEPLVRKALAELGFTPKIRKAKDGSGPYITDEGNLLLDCSGLLLDDPETMAAEIRGIVGVVEHGLFLGMADLALIADGSQVVERTE
jgi:ribose 5-phosphate isomerase A